ncbi:hypothetical protein [Exiguobacterium profundum]|uniref:hypothetical protein n=1 Tax=Exiguobacterium profundum TaxID=307643 RepID=UPI0039192392
MNKWLWSTLVVLMLLIGPKMDAFAEGAAKPDVLPTGSVVSNSEYVWRSGDPETIVHMRTGEVYTLPVRVSVEHNIVGLGDGRVILDAYGEVLIWDPITDAMTSFPNDSSSDLDYLHAVNQDLEMILWKGHTTYSVTSLTGEILGTFNTESMYESYNLLADGTVLVFANGEITKRAITGETLETLGTYTDKVRSAQYIEEANQLVVKMSTDSHLRIFDLTTKRWIEKEAESVTNLLWKDGIYYFTMRKVFDTYYVSYNVATGEWKESSVDDTFVNLRGDWYVLSHDVTAGYTPESFWKAPRQLLIDVPKTTTRYEVNQSYQVNGTAKLIDGTSIPVSGTELSATYRYSEKKPFVWEQGKLTMNTNGGYSFEFGWNGLERTEDFVASNYVPLTLDPPTGVLGPITGTTAPNTPVFVSVTKSTSQYTDSLDSLVNYQSKTVQSDETGRFTWQPTRWFAPGSRVTVKIGSPSSVYADPIELVTVKESEDTSPNDITLVTNSVKSGVTLQTTPQATIDIVARSERGYEAWSEQVNEDGMLQIKSFSHMWFGVGTKIYYKLQEAPASQFRLAEVKATYDAPIFTWTRTPLMYDKSIDVTSSTNEAYEVYRNDILVTKTSSMPYTFDTPLREGDVIRVKRTYRDATYELTKTVRAFTPVLSVTDVMMTKTQATLSIKKTSVAPVRFYVNGVVVSPKRLSTTRYTIPAKPGDTIRVRAFVGSKSREVTVELPKTSLSTLSINDEKSLWVGYVLPNSTVTLKSGTKTIASGTASSTGRVTLRFSRQPVGSVVTLTSQQGTYRHIQKKTVTVGPAPTLSSTIPSSASKTLRATSNVAYGTLTLMRGTTVLAEKEVKTTSTILSFSPQRKGTQLTLRLVTPKGRSVTKTFTVR